MKSIKNILVVRTDRIGDVVLTLPVAEIIKKHLPGCKVSFLVREYTAPVLANHPFIDETIILKEDTIRQPIKANIDILKQKKFDAAIVVYPNPKIAYILFRSGIKRRVGTGYRWYSFLFNKRIFVHRKSGNRHELEYNVELLSKIGIFETITKDDVRFNIQIEENNRHYIDEILQKSNFNNSLKTLIFHPGSGGSAVNLPNSKFSELLRKTAQELNINIILTGSEGEKEITSAISKNVLKCIDLTGKLNLGELIALIDKSDLLVANSTGPIHIAAALKKFVVGFYPKVHSMSPKRWGPYTNSCKIFQPEIECSNCTLEQCRELNCMSSINIDNVFGTIKQKIESGKDYV